MDTLGFDRDEAICAGLSFIETANRLEFATVHRKD